MIYVDDIAISYGGRSSEGIHRNMIMYHMIADTRKELFTMVDKIGVDRKWIQKVDTYEEHFDICKAKRKLAVKAGAREVTTREIVKMLRNRRSYGTLT